MKENNHDFTEELHDDATYPDTLRITVGSADEGFDAALEQLEDGPADEAVRSYPRVADVRELLTDRRLEVMRAIMTQSPESISDLAEHLERNYADVHGDVQTLAEHHIVYFDTDGRAKRPVIPYGRVHLDIEVAPGTKAGAAPA